MSTFSANRRILSVWLPRLPTDRYCRLQRQQHGVAPPDEKPLVVAAKIDNALQLVALNDAAASTGLVVGLPLATARAMLPALEVIDADPVADGKTLNAIADWCDRFTPLVALDGTDGLFLDITGCAHLFGGEARMMAAVCDALSRQGFIVSGAIAGTAVAARALTRHSHGRIVVSGGEAAAVAPLSIATLGVDEKIVRGLNRAGLKTIGDVAFRMPAEITARFGAAFTSILQQALGQGDAPISPRKPAPDYVVEKRFAEPVATHDAIMLTLSLAERCADRGHGAAWQGRAAPGGKFLPHRRRGTDDCGGGRPADHAARGGRAAVRRKARCIGRSARSRFRF